MNRVLIALIISLWALNCVGTDVGNPVRSAPQMHLEFSVFDDTAPEALTLENGLEIDEAWMVFTRLRLRHADPCDEDQDLFMREPIVADLLNPESVFGTEELFYGSGQFCQFGLEFDSIDANELREGAPAELGEHSILIRGRRADGTAFELRSDFSDRLRLDAENGAFRLEEDPESLEVAFAANSWFDVTALDAIESEVDLILIDDENHVALLDHFEAAVKPSARLFRKNVLIARGEDG